MRMKARKSGGVSPHKAELKAEAKAYAGVCRQLAWLDAWMLNFLDPESRQSLPIEPSDPKTHDVFKACSEALGVAKNLVGSNPAKYELELVTLMLSLRSLTSSLAYRAEINLEDCITRKAGRPKAKGVTFTTDEGAEFEFITADSFKAMQTAVEKIRNLRLTKADSDVAAYLEVEQCRCRLADASSKGITTTAAINALIDESGAPHREREARFNSLRSKHSRGRKKLAGS